MKKSASFRLFPVLLVTAALAVAFVGGTYIYLRQSQKQTAVSLSESLQKAEVQTLRARRVLISPSKEITTTVYTDKSVVVQVQFDTGSVAKETEITVVPVMTNKGYIAGVKILPETIRFKKPITVTVDTSHSTFTFDAPKTVTAQKKSYVSHVRALKIEQDKRLSAFVVHPLVTATQATVRLITGGSYIITSPSDETQKAARLTVDTPHVGSLALMESVLQLVDTKQSISQKTKKEAENAAAELINKRESIGMYEYLQAQIVAEKLKTLKKTSFLPQVYAQEGNIRGYLEYQCKKEHTVQEYVLYAQNAQLFGYDDIGEGCLTAAKNRVAQEARELLDSSSPSLQALVAMLAKVQMFGLDKLDIAIQDKITSVAKKQAEDVLNDPNATPEEIVKRLQELQALTNETGLQQKLEQKAQQQVSQQVESTLNDPQATNVEVAIALQQAQAFGLEQQAQQAANRLKQMSTRSYEEILANPRSTAAELSNAWADAYEKGVDKSIRDEIKKKWKSKEQEEAKPTPTPSPRQGDAEENLEFVGFDENLLGLALAQAFGLESFDEQGLKAFADEKKEQAEQMNKAAEELCSLIDSGEFMELYNAIDVPGKAEMYQQANSNCAEYIESGKAMRDMDQAVDDVYTFAEEVGETQSLDWEQEDQSPHMEIEITPTPEPEEQQIQEETLQQEGEEGGSPEQETIEFQSSSAPEE